MDDVFDEFVEIDVLFSWSSVLIDDVFNKGLV